MSVPDDIGGDERKGEKANSFFIVKSEAKHQGSVCVNAIQFHIRTAAPSENHSGLTRRNCQAVFYAFARVSEHTTHEASLADSPSLLMFD